MEKTNITLSVDPNMLWWDKRLINMLWWDKGPINYRLLSGKFSLFWDRSEALDIFYGSHIDPPVGAWNGDGGRGNDRNDAEGPSGCHSSQVLQWVGGGGRYWFLSHCMAFACLHLRSRLFSPYGVIDIEKDSVFSAHIRSLQWVVALWKRDQNFL